MTKVNHAFSTSATGTVDSLQCAKLQCQSITQSKWCLKDPHIFSFVEFVSNTLMIGLTPQSPWLLLSQFEITWFSHWITEFIFLISSRCCNMSILNQFVHNSRRVQVRNLLCIRWKIYFVPIHGHHLPHLRLSTLIVPILNDKSSFQNVMAGQKGKFEHHYQPMYG